jgi:NAD(P)H-flavin reductase
MFDDAEQAEQVFRLLQDEMTLFIAKGVNISPLKQLVQQLKQMA